MAPQFVLCPECNRPVYAHEASCPFCGEALASQAPAPQPLASAAARRALAAGPAAGALTVGLSLAAGCSLRDARATPPDGPAAPSRVDPPPHGDRTSASAPDARTVDGAAAPARSDAAAGNDAARSAGANAARDAGTMTVRGTGSTGGDGGARGAPPPAGLLQRLNAGLGHGVYGAPPAALVRRGRVLSGIPTVRGALSPEIVRRVTRRSLNQLVYCYERARMADPATRGRVVLEFVIGPSGAVTGLRVAQSTVSVAAASECMANAVRRWTFPTVDGGGVVTVSYAFDLVPPE